MVFQRLEDRHRERDLDRRFVAPALGLSGAEQNEQANEPRVTADARLVGGSGKT